MYVPVLGEERYTINEIKRAYFSSTTLDGMQPGKGRGAGERGRCDLRLYKRLVWTQKQHVCDPKNNNNMSIPKSFYRSCFVRLVSSTHFLMTK